MEGWFSHVVRVRFAETDAQGIAHHASYLVWFEEARVALLAAVAGGYPAIRARGIEALTTGVEVTYERAAVFDDVLTVHVRCPEARGATVPLRVRRRAGRREDRDRVDETRDGRRDDPPPGARPGLASRRPAQRVGAAVGLVDVGGGLPPVEPSPTAGAGVVVSLGAVCAGFGFFGRCFVPMRTTVGSPT